MELALRLAGNLWWFWESRGHFGEGRRWLEEVLAMDDGRSAPAKVKVLAGAAWLALYQGDFERLAAASEEGLDLGAEAAPDSSSAVVLLLARGVAAREQRDVEQATKLLEKGLALSREAGDRWCIALSLINLGGLWSDRGDSKRAIELLEEGLVLGRELGDPALLAALLTGLGYEFLLQNDHERATALNEEAVTLLRQQGYRAGLELAIDNLGWAALLRGDEERARDLLQESLDLARELDVSMVIPESLEGLACVAAARDEDGRAARLFGAAQALRRLTGVPLLPTARALREPYLRAARSRLGDVAWTREREEGRAMCREEAVTYALEDGGD